MATPSSVTPHDSEDEVRDSPTPAEGPTSPTYTRVSDDTTAEEDPSEEDPSEAEPSEESMRTDTSEEEPMELEPYEDSPPSPVAPTAPTPPTRAPSFRPYRIHPGGPRMMQTPRKTVRPPRPSPYPIPTPADASTSRARCRAAARRWDWLPSTLQTWRSKEGIQVPMETEESPSTHISPYTQEPSHHTVPILAVRLCHLERRIDAMEIDHEGAHLDWMHMARSQISRIEEDQLIHRQFLDITHDQGIENRDEVAALRSRIEQCEQRSHEAEEHSR